MNARDPQLDIEDAASAVAASAAASSDAALLDAVLPDAVLSDAVLSDAALPDAASRDVASRDAASRDASRDAASLCAASPGAASRDVAGTDVAGTDAADQDAADQDATPRVGPAGDSSARGVAARVDRIDWNRLAVDLDAEGSALVERLLEPAECEALRALYAIERRFRSRVVMARHGFGRGEYKYFDHPLPDLVAALRTALYARLSPIANRWNEAMHIDVRFPARHAEFIARCHAAGQTRPTPLLLQYGTGDYNCLHQDLYGEHVFPLQVVILLSEPGRDFSGGEFVMTEQRPRMQSRPIVLPLRQGDGAVIAVHQRPVQGTRGTYRVHLRHGVSRVRSGHRYAAGIIFHDAA